MPAYVIADVRGTLAKYGGRFVVRGGAHEGD